MFLMHHAFNSYTRRTSAIYLLHVVASYILSRHLPLEREFHYRAFFPTAYRGRIAPPVFFLSKETRYWLLQALEGAQNIVRQGNPHKFWFLGVQPVFWRNTLAPGGEMHHMGDTF